MIRSLSKQPSSHDELFFTVELPIWYEEGKLCMYGKIIHQISPNNLKFFFSTVNEWKLVLFQLWQPFDFMLLVNLRIYLEAGVEIL